MKSMNQHTQLTPDFYVCPDRYWCLSAKMIKIHLKFL